MSEGDEDLPERKSERRTEDHDDPPSAPSHSASENEARNKPLGPKRNPSRGVTRGRGTSNWAKEAESLRNSIEAYRTVNWAKEAETLRNSIEAFRAVDWVKELEKFRINLEAVRAVNWAKEAEKFRNSIEAYRTVNWAKEAETLRNSIEAYRTVNWAKEAETLRNSIEAFRAVDWAEELEKFSKTTTHSPGSWSELFLLLQKSAGPVQAPGLALQAAAVAETLATSGALGEVPALRKGSFLVDAVATLQESELSDDDLTFASTVESVVNSFLTHIASAKTWIEQQSFWIMLVLALIALYYQRASYLNDLAAPSPDVVARSIREGTTQLNGKLDWMAEQLEAVKPVPPTTPPAIVIRSARVRSGPGTDHQIVARLTVGDLVEVFDRKGEWLKIGFYDAIDGTTRTGWIHSRLMRSVGSDLKLPAR